MDYLYTAVIYNKTITGNTFAQIKRLASIEANKRYNIEDSFRLLFAPGTDPIIFRRRNKKTPNNTITRGAWN